MINSKLYHTAQFPYILVLKVVIFKCPNSDLGKAFDLNTDY